MQKVAELDMVYRYTKNEKRFIDMKIVHHYKLISYGWYIFITSGK